MKENRGRHLWSGKDMVQYTVRQEPRRQEKLRPTGIQEISIRPGVENLDP